MDIPQCRHCTQNIVMHIARSFDLTYYVIRLRKLNIEKILLTFDEVDRHFQAVSIPMSIIFIIKRSSI